MMFLINQTLKNIKKHLGINIVIALTLFVAYLFFFMICCHVEDGMLGVSSFALKDMDRSIYFYGQARQLQRQASISQKEFEDFSAQYEFIQSMAVVEYGYYFDSLTGEGLTIYRVDEGFQSHFTFPLIRGRYFSKDEIREGASVCVIGEGFWLQSDLDVGDTLKVGKHNLTIIGVMKYTANASANLVPYKTFEDDNIPSLEIQGYTVAATLSDTTMASEINWSELGLIGEPLSGETYFNQGLDSLFQRSTVFFVVGILILFYALMNLINILVSKMYQQQKSLGVRIALGASYRQVFLQFFLESLVLVLAAVICVFCCDPIIAVMTRNILNHYFGPMTVVIMLIISVFSVGEQFLLCHACQPPFVNNTTYHSLLRKYTDIFLTFSALSKKPFLCLCDANFEVGPYPCKSGSRLLPGSCAQRRTSALLALPKRGSFLGQHRTKQMHQGRN